MCYYSIYRTSWYFSFSVIYLWKYLAVVVNLRYYPFGPVALLRTLYSAFFSLHIFLNLAVFCFDNYQMGIGCSAYLCIFFSERRWLIGARPLELQQLMLSCWAAFKFNVLCIMSHPTLKSIFENNQSVMGGTLSCFPLAIRYSTVFELVPNEG